MMTQFMDKSKMIKIDNFKFSILGDERKSYVWWEGIIYMVVMQNKEQTIFLHSK